MFFFVAPSTYPGLQALVSFVCPAAPHPTAFGRSRGVPGGLRGSLWGIPQRLSSWGLGRHKYERPAVRHALAPQRSADRHANDISFGGALWRAHAEGKIPSQQLARGVGDVARRPPLHRAACFSSSASLREGARDA